MAKKKSFNFGNSLRQALTETVMAAENYSGELHIEAIPLRKIILDLDNPRELMLAPNDLYTGLSRDDEFYNRKIIEKESLKSIANSIAEQGIINPIVVYKYGEQYKLIAGERRTLASILAGKEDIPAKILSSKPTQLKLGLLQWIENIEREDLSLWERLKNLEKICMAYSEEQKKDSDQITATELSKLIGCSLQQSVNYKNILEAPSKLRLLIQKNEIKNIEKAAFIAKAPTELQEQLIDICLKGATLKELKKLVDDNKDSIKKSTLNALHKETRGRQAVRINFGVTKNLNAAKTIIQCILLNDNFSYLADEIGKIEWHDFGAVTKAFKSILKTIETMER